MREKMSSEDGSKSVDKIDEPEPDTSQKNEGKQGGKETRNHKNQ
jgi:hypothetical protein